MIGRRRKKKAETKGRCMWVVGGRKEERGGKGGKCPEDAKSRWDEGKTDEG
jgi:hypothetical protein